ncbi:hypothetical protein SDC9_66299 [bioreactor metagenome]|uniref:SLH domain-containing protein n=1 Tax=bioreactor metagenome TaxID=1076179 RepID=A0A644XUI2_9ZZZZ
MEIKGGSLSAKSGQSLTLCGGTCSFIGGTVSSDTFALVSFGCAVTISDGTMSSGSSTSVYITSDGSINMTEGKIENTGSGVALNLHESAKAPTISGGNVTSAGGFGVFSAGKLTVADGAACTDNGNGSFTFTMAGGSVTVSTKFFKQSSSPFRDVADSAYYYDAVLWAVEQGVTNGTGAAAFSPEGGCTRVQIATFLYRHLSK